MTSLVRETRICAVELYDNAICPEKVKDYNHINLPDI